MEFSLHIGIDYSGAQTPTSRLVGLQVYAATTGLPERIPTPAAPQSKSWNWTRQEIAEWLIAQARSGQRFIAGIDHGFSFPLNYFERHKLTSWPEFLEDFVAPWIDTPHVPHGWDCGVLFDQSTGTLLCGDLFTQPGAETPPVTESEILTASEAMRRPMDYYAHSTKTTKILERLASVDPKTLACQHGSAYRGNGAGLLRELAAILERELRSELD